MSTTAYRNTHSSRSFTPQHIRPSPANSKHPIMINDRSKYQTQTNILPPVPPLRDSLPNNCLTSSKALLSVSPPPSSSTSPLEQSNSIKKSPHENSTSKIYTFSNPPRELQRQSIQNMKYLRNNRLRQRVSSAPDENSFQNSPRSFLTHPKPSSANDSSTPRSHEDNQVPLLPLNLLLKQRDEQEKHSLNALKEQERSKVPKAVQKRRIILLFRRLPPSTSPLISPRQQQNLSPIKLDHILPDHQTQTDKRIPEEIQHFANTTTSQQTNSSTNDPFYGFEQYETADSKQIAAILAGIQSLDDWMPNSVNDSSSPRCQQKTFDPKKYEYISKNSLDTTTFKLSPRTLKPDEEMAARSRHSQNYRYEMFSSTNAQIPPLMASIVAENNNNSNNNNNNSIGGLGLDTTFTFKLNSTTTTTNMKNPNIKDYIEPIQSGADGEQVQLCFDEILKCFYDPKTGTYYELTSA